MKFLFSEMNFEDVLTLHLEKSLAYKWVQACNANNHFSSPMSSKTICPLFKSILNINYQKGEIPIDIDVDKDSLLNLYVNLKDPNIPIESHFHRYIYKYLESFR